MEIKINKYILTKELGKGAYGNVYLAKYYDVSKGEIEGEGKVDSNTNTNTNTIKEKPFTYSQIVEKETLTLQENTYEVGSQKIDDFTEKQVTETKTKTENTISKHSVDKSRFQKEKIFAIKKIKNERRFQNASLREIEYLKTLNTNNSKNAPIIKLLDTFIDNEIQYLVFEHMEINMYRYYQKFRFSYEQVTYVFYQLCTGFQYIHSHKIIHGDLKPENIMLNSKTGQIKIIDFGSSFSVGKHINHFYIQSRYYRAPELCYQIEASTAIDIWSIGCVIYELLFRKPLFPARESRYELIYLFTTLLGIPLAIPRCENTYFYSQVFKNQFDWNRDSNTYYLKKYYPDDQAIDSEGLSKKLNRKFNETFPDVDATEIKNVLDKIITYDYTERSNATDILQSSIFLRYSIDM